jgi:ferredoxin-NADP reductase
VARHPSNPSGADPSLETVYATALVHRRWLSAKAFEIGLSRPAGFDFQAGQSICFVHEGRTRHYSLTNGPAEPGLSLLVRHLREGVFTPVLAEAELGTRFQYTGPHGYFLFRPSQRPAVFVATGTGIAPFMAMFRSGIHAALLLHGVRTADELYYERFLRTLPVRYVACLSENDAAESPADRAYAGKVTGYLKNRLDRRAYDFYLCGRQDMVRDVTLLADEYFPASHIYTEVFY